MPFIVEAEELKKVARLVTGLKDTSPKALRDCCWNGVHRMIAEDDRFRLLTTDREFFLDWDIPVKDGLNGEDFDLAISAGRFNEMISFASNDGFELEYLTSSRQLVFHQGERTLRLDTTPVGAYPTPPDVGSSSWTTDAQRLSRELRFMVPLIDAKNTNAARSVVTLSSPGVLIGGSPKRYARVTGLDSPPTPMNLKQKPAKVLAEFLGALTGLVDITDASPSGGSTGLRIMTPDSRRSIVVNGESTPFQDTSQSLESEPIDQWRVDRKLWLRGINIIHAVQPPGTDWLTLRIRGDGEQSSIRISSSKDEADASHDEFPIFRFPVSGDSTSDNSRRPEDVLNVSAGTMREILQAMSADSVIVEHFINRQLLRTRDDARPADPVRSILIDIRAANRSRTASDQVLERVQDNPADAPSNPLDATSSASATTIVQGDPVETSNHEDSPTEDGKASTAGPEPASTPEQCTTPDASIDDRGRTRPKENRRPPSDRRRPEVDPTKSD